MGTSLTLSSPRRAALWLAIGFAIAALMAAQALPVRAGGEQILYGADGAGGNPATNLYILDPATGAIVTTVGPIGFAVTGLAFHPTTGVLYGTTGRASPASPGFLITIDTSTGSGTLVGDLDASSDETAADITFGTDGTLYGWLEPGTDSLVTIDITTGAATVVGNSGLSTAGAALAGSGNPLILAGSEDSGPLHLIDTGTGAATAGPTMDGTTDNDISASDFHQSGTLVAVRLDTSGPRPAELITINTTTGAITVIGATVNALDAIAFGLAAPLPSVPDAAMSQPITDFTGSVLWILGFVLLVGAASLAARSVAVIRNR